MAGDGRAPHPRDVDDDITVAASALPNRPSVPDVPADPDVFSDPDATIVADEDLLSSVLKSIDQPADQPADTTRRAQDLSVHDRKDDQDDVTLPPQESSQSLWQPGGQDGVSVSAEPASIDAPAEPRIVPLATEAPPAPSKPHIEASTSTAAVSSSAADQPDGWAVEQVNVTRVTPAPPAKRIDPLLIAIGVLAVAAAVLAYLFLVGR